MDVTNVNPAYAMAVKSSSGGGAFEFSSKSRRTSSVGDRTLKIMAQVTVSQFRRDGCVVLPNTVSRNVCDEEVAG
jgi:hypothetical protein